MSGCAMQANSQCCSTLAAFRSTEGILEKFHVCLLALHSRVAVLTLATLPEVNRQIIVIAYAAGNSIQMGSEQQESSLKCTTVSRIAVGIDHRRDTICSRGLDWQGRHS